MQTVRIRVQACRAGMMGDEFDRAFGVKTRVAMSLRDLYRISRRGGHDHEPTAPARFREVLGALPTPLQEAVFVDYGSGAGRAVLLASQFPFKEVVGVEMSPGLHARALANVRTFASLSDGAAPIRLVCADARTFELPPDTPAVLYFYNSFGLAAMRRVLARIETSLTRSPRPVTLIAFYCDYETRTLMEQSRMFRVLSAERGVTVLRSLCAEPATGARPAPARSTA